MFYTLNGLLVRSVSTRLEVKLTGDGLTKFGEAVARRGLEVTLRVVDSKCFVLEKVNGLFRIVLPEICNKILK